jgi:hypothetical protein
MAKKTKHAGKEREHQHMDTHTDQVMRDDVCVEIDFGGKEKDKFTVIASDDDGYYFTQKHWVGTRLLDPNRDPLRRRPLTSLTTTQLNAYLPAETEKA